MALKLISLAAVLVASVTGQMKYCCMPVEWESVNMFTEGQIATGMKVPVITEGEEMTSVDGTKHRLASLSTLTSGGFKVNVQVIQLFDEGIMYIVQSGECKKYPLPPWTPKCVPDNAQLIAHTYYGAGNEKINVDIYNIIVDPNTVYLTVAHADCTPIYVAGYGTAAGVSALSYKTYSNITLGIKNPSVFNVPTICKNSTLIPQKLAPKQGWF